MSTPTGQTGADARSPDAPAESLSPREAEILALIARGWTNSEVSDELFLSFNTVKSHIRSAYRKIDVDSRTQAVVWCFRNGLGDLSG